MLCPNVATGPMRMGWGNVVGCLGTAAFLYAQLRILIREFWMPNSDARNGRWGSAMSGWSQGLGAGAGVVMVVGGLLVLGGYRWGWVLGAAAAAAAAVTVSGLLGAGRRSG